MSVEFPEFSGSYARVGMFEPFVRSETVCGFQRPPPKSERDPLLNGQVFREVLNGVLKGKKVLRLITHRMPHAYISYKVRIGVSTFSLPCFLFSVEWQVRGHGAGYASYLRSCEQRC